MDDTNEPSHVANPIRTCPFHGEMVARMERVERALYGDPNDPRSPAMVPTMRRLQAYMDGACWAFRALLLGLPAALALITAGRSMGWW